MANKKVNPAQPTDTGDPGQELDRLRKLIPKLEEAERLHKALLHISELVETAADMDHFYRDLHEIIGNLMYAENFYVAFYETGGEKIVFPYFVDTVDGFAPREMPWEMVKRGLTALLLRSGKPLLLSTEDAQKFRRQGDIEVLGSLPNSWLGVPLKRGDQTVGAVVVQSYEKNIAYGEPDRDLLLFVSQHIVRALERREARLELERRVAQRTEELQTINRELESEVRERRRAERLQAALFSITELSHAATDMSDFYENLHRILESLIYAENFYVAVWNEDRTLIEFPYRRDTFDSKPEPRLPGKGLTEYVLTKEKGVLIDKGKLEEMIAAGEVEQRGTPSLYWLGVPLVIDEVTHGVLVVQSYNEEHRYQPRDMELLKFVSRHVATALARKKAAEALKQAHEELERRVVARTIELEKEIIRRKAIQEQLHHDAMHDTLTGLPNRNLFRDRLDQTRKRFARDPSNQYAVMFLDLDRFKVINDSLGHMVGDELLIGVGNRISHCLRESDTVARLGGDEFAVLLDRINDLDEAKNISARICERLTEPFDLDKHRVFTSTSIGIAMGSPRYEHSEELLRDADAAMYRAKQAGRKQYAVFDESMHQEAVAVLELENDLRRALERDEFEVLYHPIIHLSDQGLRGFEALVRWRHPRRGMLRPGVFLSLAEETGLIVPLDLMVLRKAALQAKEWRGLHPDAHLSVSVNLSSKHFNHTDFCEHIKEIIEDVQVDPNDIRIEITERALIEHGRRAREVLTQITDLNVQLMLDDFGTGYSSLNHLHRYPFDMVKIDQSFISRMLESQENLAIVKTIRALTKTLDLKVIAEGIETEAQFKALIDLGFEMGQGWYLSKPLDVAAAGQLIKAGRMIQQEN